MESEPPAKSPRKQIRLWADGCFDMMHYGHANALRQAKMLGDYLIVGVHSDEEIEMHKGPTVMKEEERYRMVEACKWVDEVVRGAPFVTSLQMLNDYNVDFCVHGDDIVTTNDGTDSYYEVKAANKFKTVPRTCGVSTTDLVGRMLLLTRSHHSPSLPSKEQLTQMSKGSSYTKVSQFFPTTTRIVQFSDGKEPAENDKVVYVEGGFDLFHIGHIEFLKAAKAIGTYLIVGVHDDKTVNSIKGSNYPLMSLYERVLGVLSCRYVDQVVIGAPLEVTQELITSFKINIVCTGTARNPSMKDETHDSDIYEIPKKLNMFVQIESPSLVTTTDIINRIIENRLNFERRNKKKEEKEKILIEQLKGQK